MLVIKSKGTTSTLTGWRAGVVFAVLCVVAVVVMAAVVMLLLGLTVTIGVIFLVVVPLAIVGAVIAELLRPMRSR
jgi:hypothetical protein